MAGFVMTVDFVQQHLSPLTKLLDSWDIKSNQYGDNQFYQLDLKMSGLSSLNWDALKRADRSYTFRVVDPLAAQLSNVLVLNASHNAISGLDHSNFSVMPEIRVLNLSTNKIARFSGISILSRLQTLDLSHNMITNLSGLQECRLLVELNVSMNNIHSLNSLPSTLISLTILNIANNKLVSLDGIQALPRLRELRCERNALADLHALCSVFGLQILDASDNDLTSLSNTVATIKALTSLHNITLQGNPIQGEETYKKRLLECRSVTMLDGEAVRPEMLPYSAAREQHTSLPYIAPRGGHTTRAPAHDAYWPPRPDNTISSSDSLDVLREAAKQAFNNEITMRRKHKEEQLRFMRSRIQDIEQEHEEYERRRERDLEACLRHLDALPVREPGPGRDRIRDPIRDSYRDPYRDPYREPVRESFRDPIREAPKYTLDFSDNDSYVDPETWSARSKPEQPAEPEVVSDSPSAEYQRERRKLHNRRPDYRSVRDTRDVLSYAKKELIREQDPLKDNY